MPTLLVVRQNNLAQQADNLTWIVGENQITFEVPFADTSYVLDLHTGDGALNVIEKPGSRTVTGVIAVVSGTPTPALTPTTTGYFYAEGRGDVVASSGYGLSDEDTENVFIQRGSQSLIEGEQFITFADSFQGVYQFIPNFNNGSGYVVEDSEEPNRVKVYSVGVNSDFKWIAVGVRA